MNKFVRTCLKIIVSKITGVQEERISRHYMLLLSTRRGIKKKIRNAIYKPYIRIVYHKLKLKNTRSPEDIIHLESKANYLDFYPSVTKKKHGNKPRLLVLSEKWHACDPHAGVSNMKYLVWDSLDEYDKVSQLHLYVDVYFNETGKQADELILKTCIEFRPDCVINLVQDAPKLRIKSETFRCINKKLKIPLIAWCSDTAQAFSLPEPYFYFTKAPEFEFPFADLYLLTDTSFLHLEKTSRPDKYMAMPTPYDGRLLTNNNEDRDIDLSFIGNSNNHSRENYLDVFLKDKINLYIKNTADKRNDRLEYPDYIKILQRSKIALNLTKATSVIGEIEQLKGRTFEALHCGAMLLEEESCETRTWLEPYVDYVPYLNKQDMHDKAIYYLNNQNERIKIAEQGTAKIKEKHNSYVYWNNVFNKIGLKEAN